MFFYLKTDGTAMGTALTPNYDNLFMGKFEAEFIYHNNPLLIETQFLPRIVFTLSR